MTATTHHHRPAHSRALLVLGLPAAIGVAFLAAASYDRQAAPTAPSELGRVTSPIPGHTTVTPLPVDGRGLHRVNSPVSAPSLPAPVARVNRARCG
jgi:hypothetical protein